VPRVERKAKNQALFRQVNERIAELAAGEPADLMQVVICECSRIGCAETLELLPSEYELVRADPTTFVVIAGHEDTDHEEVLLRTPAYLIVRNKAGVAETVARQTASKRGRVRCPYADLLASAKLAALVFASTRADPDPNIEERAGAACAIVASRGEV
jgi:hypothetical protein